MSNEKNEAENDFLMRSEGRSRMLQSDYDDVEELINLAFGPESKDWSEEELKQKMEESESGAKENLPY